ncbi:MAG: hypothetical protein EP343_21590 [Deltaproteobacteria bacterium]|nr:MAG: hypothetical protein EP343_21590 [Deltaproteobacteria bacterium]
MPEQTSLQHALTLLSEESVDPAERIHAVWLTGHWPASLFERLACDCAEHALANEKARGQEPSPVFWDVLSVKRRWLRNEATDEELQKALAQAQLLSHQASIDQKCYEAAAAVSDALRNVDYASRSMAWAMRTSPSSEPQDEQPIRLTEAQWQMQHLKTLLEEAVVVLEEEKR